MTSPSSPIPDGAWWPWAVVGVVTLALLWEPLLGFGSLLPADIVEQFDPWRSDPQSGNASVHNPFLVDTVTVHVHFASMAADLWRGEFSFWDPSVGTGFPTLKAGLPVFNWVYLIVPAWYAPGLAAALRTLSAAGLTYGLSRRLGVGRAAATVGGVAYGLSGYLIGWSAWPQSNVAALLPGLFWAVEALVQQPRTRTVAGLGAIVAAMLWANFPTITVYALVFAAIYAAVRLWTRSKPAERVAAFVTRGSAALVERMMSVDEAVALDLVLTGRLPRAGKGGVWEVKINGQAYTVTDKAGPEEIAKIQRFIEGGMAEDLSSRHPAKF